MAMNALDETGERIKVFGPLIWEKNVVTLALTAGISSMFWLGGMAFFPLWFLEKGGTVFWFMVFLAIKALTWNVFRLPFGYLADLVGRKNIIIIGTLLLGIDTFLYGYVDDWRWFLLPMILEGIIHGGYSPALNAMYADSVPDEYRSRSFATRAIIFLPFTSIGMALSVEWWKMTHDISLLMYISGILLVLATITRFFIIEETLDTNKNVKRSISQFQVGIIESTRAVFKDRLLSLLLFISLLTAIQSVLINNLTIYYLYDEKGFTDWLYGMLQVYFSIMGPIGNLVGGYFSDKHGRIWFNRLLFFTSSVGLWYFVFIDDPYSIFAILLLMNTVSQLAMPAWNSTFFDMIPKEKRAFMTGLQTFLIGIITMGLPILSGYLYEHVNKDLPFFFAAVIGTFVAFIVYLYLPESKNMLEKMPTNLKVKSAPTIPVKKT